MNLVDLLSVPALPAGSDRLVYRRSKTGRMYDIKVEPEARSIIEKWKGRELLVSWGEGRKSYRSFLMQMDKALKKIGTSDPSSGSFVPAFPSLTTYVARHSWATVAAELDVPVDVISHALGHGMGNRTTAIYIDFDQRKVDAANRRVLDWVFYGKK
jgi:integrase